MKSAVLPTLPFESKKIWADWLAKQHDKSAGVWLKLGKKGIGGCVSPDWRENLFEMTNPIDEIRPIE